MGKNFPHKGTQVSEILTGCTPSKSTSTQWGVAECPFSWVTLARFRSPADTIHIQYKPGTTKIVEKNSMA